VNSSDIWTYNRRISTRLLQWGGLNVGLGIALQAARAPFWRAFGQQAAAWGAIDALIAWLGQSGADRKEAKGDPGAAVAQRRQLAFLLWLNTGLDVLYIVGGYMLTRSDGGKASRRGHGWGIVFQGTFLFLFDLFHALGMRHVQKVERP
jgi:hypothetical protein